MKEKMKSYADYSKEDQIKNKIEDGDTEDHTCIEGYVSKINLYPLKDGSYKAPFYLVVNRRSTHMPIECIAYDKVAFSLVKKFNKEKKRKEEVKLYINGHLQSYPVNGRPVTTVVVTEFKIVR